MSNVLPTVLPWWSIVIYLAGNMWTPITRVDPFCDKLARSWTSTRFNTRRGRVWIGFLQKMNRPFLVPLGLTQICFARPPCSAMSCESDDQMAHSHLFDGKNKCHTFKKNNFNFPLFLVGMIKFPLPCSQLLWYRWNSLLLSTSGW